MKVSARRFLSRTLSSSIPLLCLVFLLVSCDRFQPKPLALPQTPPISGSLGWLLVKESYALLKTEAGGEGAPAGQLRDGAILEVLGREYGTGKTSGSRVIWYLVASETGHAWVSAEDVEVFASKEQALSAKNAAGAP